MKKMTLHQLLAEIKAAIGADDAKTACANVQELIEKLESGSDDAATPDDDGTAGPANTDRARAARGRAPGRVPEVDAAYMRKVFNSDHRPVESVSFTAGGGIASTHLARR